MRLIDEERLIEDVNKCELDLEQKITVRNMIREQPTENAVHKTGKWEQHKSVTIICLDNALEQYHATGQIHRRIISYQCSECRKLVGIDSSIAPYRFCPWCNSKMEGGEE